MKEDNKDEQRETVRDIRERGDDILVEAPLSLEEEGEILMRGLRNNPPPTREELLEIMRDQFKEELFFDELGSLDLTRMAEEYAKKLQPFAFSYSPEDIERVFGRGDR